MEVDDLSSKTVESVGCGVKSQWYCSQDCDHRRVSRKVKDPSKQRDRESMETYDCRSSLSIRVYHEKSKLQIHIILGHYMDHPKYYDIDISPEAIDIIRQHQWSKPAHIAQLIRRKPEWRHIKTYQVAHIWRTMSEKNWRFDNDQLVSAQKILTASMRDVEYLDICPPEGVIALGFSSKHITSTLKQVVEIAMDATCKSILYPMYILINL